MPTLALTTPLAANAGDGLASCVIGLLVIGGAISLIRHYGTFTLLNIGAIGFGLFAIGSGILEILRAVT